SCILPVIVEVFIAKQPVLISDQAIRLYFRRIEFDLKFDVLRNSEQRSAELVDQYFLCFLDIINVGVITVTPVRKRLHLRVLVVTHSKAEYRKINSFIALLFNESLHCRVARLTDIKITISREYDPIVAAFFEILFCNLVRKPNACAACGGSARFEPFKRVEDCAP